MLFRKSLPLFAALATTFAANHALADFPDRTVTLVVPFAAGGGPDIHARQFAQAFSERLGTTVIVENRVGAAGIVGAQAVARAEPDGYTLLLGTSAHLLQKSLQPEAPFDPMADFRGVSNIMATPAVMVVNAEESLGSVEDLVDRLRAAPDKYNYGSGGVGTPAHVAGASFLAAHDLVAQHIPLRGSVEIAPSLMRNDTLFAFPVTGTAIPQIQNGILRGLATTSAERLNQLPEVPTLYELTGDPDLIQSVWLGLWAPAGTPDDRIERLFEAAAESLADAELQAAFAKTGTLIATSESAQQYQEFIEQENDKWRSLAELVRED